MPKKQRLQLLEPSPVYRIFWGLSAVQSFLHTLQTEHKEHHGQSWHTLLSASGFRLPCAAIMELNVEFAYKFSWWVMNNTTLFINVRRLGGFFMACIPHALEIILTNTT